MHTAVLLIAFNTPERMSLVFDTIKKVLPPRLYVAVDGSRSADEAEKCIQSQKIIDKVDWPCDVKTLYREKNLG